jgi:hypothetical protein
LVIDCEGKVCEEKPWEPIACEAIVNDSWGRNFRVVVDGYCHFREGKYVNEKVDFHQDPYSEGNIAHEVVKKAQIVNSCMAAQKRRGYAHQTQSYYFCSLQRYLYTEELNILIGELISNVTVYRLHQAELGVDAQKYHC